MFAAAVITAAVLFASGCATVKPAGNEDLYTVIELLNSGNSAELTKLSADSFLFDTEILHGSSLTSALWNGLTSAGFKINNPAIIESRPAAAGDIQFFGKTTETEAFFAKYVPPQSMLFRLGTDGGSYVFILGPAEKRISKIIAFGGPY